MQRGPTYSRSERMSESILFLILVMSIGALAVGLGIWCASLYSKVIALEKRKSELETEKNLWETEKTARVSEYDSQIRSLLQAREELNQERAQVREDQIRKQKELFERKKMNWAEHEDRATDALKVICRKLDLNFFDKSSFPLAKRPDFAIELAGQYVIFDAKAPSDPENVSYFPEYLKKQAEALEKYLKQEGVRKEGFLVVPSDSLTQLGGRFFFEIGGHQIYVVPPESLEAILRLLRKIEDFEVIEGLGPEEQDSIATYIGQSNRLMKRRVQIDQFLSKKMIDVLQSGEALPEEIRDRVLNKEKSFAINPPRVDRGKNLSTSEIEKDQIKLQSQLR